jgi:nicotinamidase-related amidase
MSQVQYENNVRALVEIGKLFNLPTIIVSNTVKGPHGQVLPFIRETLPNAKMIDREGAVNVWEIEDFQKAVKNTGLKRFIVAGLGIDSVMGFPVLSLLE